MTDGPESLGALDVARSIAVTDAGIELPYRHRVLTVDGLSVDAPTADDA